MRKAQRVIPFYTLVFAVSITVGFAKQKPQIQHAPLPNKVITATKLFIQNDSGDAATADTAYGILKSWGRYQIVTAKQDADLILVLSTVLEQRSGSEAEHTSSYNYKTGAWTSGTVTVPTTDTWHYTQMNLVDPLTGDIEWQDRRIWWRKHHPIQELINSLRERIEEQQRQAQR
ncbi:MAG TPA: hypothetical protein VNY78_04095 [Edaphobacter sp.]|jgi:hypothetical protein|nr:hypothetical protein [Edaphobacter sp.]